MSAACQRVVQACAHANASKGPTSVSTSPDIPGKPWSEATIDTLEFGPDHSGRYHCALAMVDMSTKWVEVTPLL